MTVFHNLWLKATSSADALIKPVYISGVDFIEALQISFKIWEPILYAIYQLADPWVIYFILFPLMYYNSMRMGLRLVWAAGITEYVCAILKLLIHGHRPYWYMQDSTYHLSAPKMTRFTWACETTPATPSDRTMVTACICSILVTHYCNCKGLSPRCQWPKYVAVWLAYFGFQVLILISGAYFATTFPHQAIIGTLMGKVMSRRFSATNILDISFVGFAWMMFFMNAIYFLIYGFLVLIGHDPAWALARSSMSCIKLAWNDIYRDHLTEQAVRASGFVTGIGLATRFFTTNALKITDGCPTKVKLVHGLVGVATIIIIDASLQPSFGISSVLHYAFQFLKYTIPPILIITDVPVLTGISKLIIGVLFEDAAVRSKYFAQLGGDDMTPCTDSVCGPCPISKEECRNLRTHKHANLCSSSTHHQEGADISKYRSLNSLTTRWNSEQ